MSTTNGTGNFISHVKNFALLHWYFPKYVLLAQYGCYQWFLDVVLSGYIIIIIMPWHNTILGV
jgi:hypothetical protein